MVEPTERIPYLDPSLPIPERVADLLTRMTVAEKAAQLSSIWIRKWPLVTADGGIDVEVTSDMFPDGIGFVGRPVDAMGMPGFMQERWHRTREETLAFVNAMQRFLIEKTRLGIPALYHDETAHGFVAAGATVFPIPLALASTWDADLIEKIFSVVAREGRSVGSTVSLGPVLDIARDPRYGRVEEMFGEDPYLVGRLGAAAVHGVQGRERPLAKDKMFATLKHFVHGVPEGGVNIGPAEMTERTLWEVYLEPFAHVIRAADPAFIMPSYNLVSGAPAHGSRSLLNGVGRNVLGFRGAYLSDYDGIPRLADDHRVVTDDAEAAALAIESGVDVDLPDSRSFAHLPELVASGAVDGAVLDQAVARVLGLKFEAGLFESPYARVDDFGYGDPAAARLARTSATRALTLLKNNGVLPLDPKSSLRVAVIGPNADRVHYGNYSGENEGISVLAGLRAACADTAITVDYAEGVRILEEDPNVFGAGRMPIVLPDEGENRRRIREAADLAHRADVVILVVGDHPSLTRETTRPSHPGDRSELGLFGQQDELVEAIAATGKPIVAVLLNGRPLAVPRLAEAAQALLEGWYLGQEGGAAVADVLLGSAEPGGRLPVSIPRSVGALPVYYGRRVTSTLHPYIETDRSPLFPFGHGLGFTTFSISQPLLDRDVIRAHESAVVSVTVTNTGVRSGAEIVQLYVRDEVASIPRPELELRGFERVELEAGETKDITFVLAPDDLALWNRELTERTVETGFFTIYVGRSSIDLLSVEMEVRQ